MFDSTWICFLSIFLISFSLFNEMFKRSLIFIIVNIIFTPYEFLKETIYSICLAFFFFQADSMFKKINLRHDRLRAWAKIPNNENWKKDKFYLIIQNPNQFSSVTQSCPTLCDPMNRSTPGLPVHHQLPEFTQTHVHRVSDAIQPSHP